MKDQAEVGGTADHASDRQASNCDAGPSEHKTAASPAGEQAADDSVDDVLDRLRTAATEHERS